VINAPATDGLGGIIQANASAAGSRIPFSQKFVGTLAANYTRDIGGMKIILNTTATYNGGYNLDINFAHQDAYVALNSSVTFSDLSENISLRLGVTNALNKAFLQKVITGAGAARATYGAPRIFSATASFKFR
jgi:iron complex outermembrane recepter protein